MRKYKLNSAQQRKIVTDAMIKKHMDFNKLRAEYNDVVKRPAVPLYRNKKLFLLMLILGLIAWLVAEAIEKDRDKNKKTFQQEYFWLNEKHEDSTHE
jgi:hypothetical protein